MSAALAPAVSDLQAAAASLARASGLDERVVRARMAANAAGFWPKPPGALEQWLRRNLLTATRHGDGIGYAVTSALKTGRNMLAKPIPDPAQLPLLAAAAQRAARGGACVLTHDVDWAACYDALDWLCALETAHNVRSTFHFLTEWQYRPAPDRLAALRQAGFEIGLHGRLHDAGLGYRPRADIVAELKRALERLPPGIAAYRAPTLCLSAGLLSALRDVGLGVDSSMLVVNRYGPPAESVWPYRIAEGIVELPLAIQDDLLFRDLRLSDERALRLVAGCMGAILAAGGVFVFNGHPGILRDHERFYRGLLDAMTATGCPIVTVSQAAAGAPAAARGPSHADLPAGRA
jgi:hypothetical protein